jgi:acetylornithine deacetylase
MDPLDLLDLAQTLIDVDSTTGRERECGRLLASHLEALGWRVTEQSVDGDRFNIYATLRDKPRVVFSTHLDCVPPFISSRVDGGRLYGRGACDAKGILAAQITAAERLRRAGTDDVALLFVVGEERGSDGASAANRERPGTAFLVNGEPTDNRLALATRGVLRLRLSASGKAAHSSYPELGESAIEKLLDALAQLKTLALPEDALLGRTHYTIGLIRGGMAPNVVPAHAEAEVMFRTVGDAAVVRALVGGLRTLVDIHEILEMPPVRMRTVDGFETAVFPYTTDIAMLSNWGEPLLYGPGSILVAHSDDEHVEIGALERAVEDYVRIANALPAPDAPGT